MYWGLVNQKILKAKQKVLGRRCCWKSRWWRETAWDSRRFFCRRLAQKSFRSQKHSKHSLLLISCLNPLQCTNHILHVHWWWTRKKSWTMCWMLEVATPWHKTSPNSKTWGTPPLAGNLATALQMLASPFALLYSSDSNHYINHTQIITELCSLCWYLSNLNKTSCKLQVLWIILVGYGWHAVAWHGNATCIMRWDATNDFALAGDASGNPGDGGNPGELTAAFHRQSMKKQYKLEHKAVFHHTFCTPRADLWKISYKFRISASNE